MGGHAQANLSNSRFIIYVVVAVLMVVLLLTSPFYSVLVGDGYVLIKCYTAPYIRIHADITWIPPFVCSLKFESELISQTELAILLSCIVSLPQVGFASSFSTHRVLFTRSATSFSKSTSIGTIAYCVGGFSFHTLSASLSY